MKTLICLEDALNIAMQYCPDDDGSCSKSGVDIREMLDELESLPSVQTERQWIPCSNKTPKKTGYYICTCHDGVCYRTSTLKWSTGWVLTGARSYWKVIAWMPLPEPWKGGVRE